MCKVHCTSSAFIPNWVQGTDKRDAWNLATGQVQSIPLHEHMNNIYIYARFVEHCHEAGWLNYFYMCTRMTATSTYMWGSSNLAWARLFQNGYKAQMSEARGTSSLSKSVDVIHIYIKEYSTNLLSTSLAHWRLMPVWNKCAHARHNEPCMYVDVIHMSM